MGTRRGVAGNHRLTFEAVRATIEDLGLANLDIYAECLRRAHENMGYLLGEQEKDRVLGEIFSNFCIGK